MFSPGGYTQEVVALAVAVVAALYILSRIIGWPRLPGSKSGGPPVHTGRRLARGLAKARRR